MCYSALLCPPSSHYRSNKALSWSQLSTELAAVHTFGVSCGAVTTTVDGLSLQRGHHNKLSLQRGDHNKFVHHQDDKFPRRAKLNCREQTQKDFLRCWSNWLRSSQNKEAGLHQYIFAQQVHCGGYQVTTNADDWRTGDVLTSIWPILQHWYAWNEGGTVCSVSITLNVWVSSLLSPP